MSHVEDYLDALDCLCRLFHCDLVNARKSTSRIKHAYTLPMLRELLQIRQHLEVPVWEQISEPRATTPRPINQECTKVIS